MRTLPPRKNKIGDDTEAPQRAFDAISASGGVLGLAAGTYDLGLDREPDTLVIGGSHVVIRGARPDRTIPRLHRGLFKDPEEGYGDPILQVGPADHNPSRWRRKPVADTPRGGTLLHLEDSADFAVDMPVRVLLFNPAIDGRRGGPCGPPPTSCSRKVWWSGSFHADEGRRVLIDRRYGDRHDEWIRIEGLNRPGLHPPSLYEAQRTRR